MKQIMCLFCILSGIISLHAQNTLQEQWEKNVLHVSIRLAAENLVINGSKYRPQAEYILNGEDTLNFSSISTYLQNNDGGQTNDKVFAQYYNSKIDITSYSLDTLLNIDCLDERYKNKLQDVIQKLRKEHSWYNPPTQDSTPSNSSYDNEIYNRYDDCQKQLRKLQNDMSALFFLLLLGFVLLSVWLGILTYFITFLSKDRKKSHQKIIAKLENKLNDWFDEKMGPNAKNYLEMCVHELQTKSSQQQKTKEIKELIENFSKKFNELESRVSNIEKNQSNQLVNPSKNTEQIKDQDRQAQNSLNKADVNKIYIPTKNIGSGVLRECEKSEALFNLVISSDNQNEAEITYCGTLEQAKENADDIFKDVAEYDGDCSAAHNVKVVTMGIANKLESGKWKVSKHAHIEFE